MNETISKDNKTRVKGGNSGSQNNELIRGAFSSSLPALRACLSFRLCRMSSSSFLVRSSSSLSRFSPNSRMRRRKSLTSSPSVMEVMTWYLVERDATPAFIFRGCKQTAYVQGPVPMSRKLIKLLGKKKKISWRRTVRLHRIEYWDMYVAVKYD